MDELNANTDDATLTESTVSSFLRKFLLTDDEPIQLNRRNDADLDITSVCTINLPELPRRYEASISVDIPTTYLNEIIHKTECSKTICYFRKSLPPSIKIIKMICDFNNSINPFKTLETSCNCVIWIYDKSVDDSKNTIFIEGIYDPKFNNETKQKFKQRLFTFLKQNLNYQVNMNDDFIVERMMVNEDIFPLYKINHPQTKILIRKKIIQSRLNIENYRFLSYIFKIDESENKTKSHPVDNRALLRKLIQKIPSSYEIIMTRHCLVKKLRQINRSVQNDTANINRDLEIKISLADKPVLKLHERMKTTDHKTNYIERVKKYYFHELSKISNNTIKDIKRLLNNDEKPVLQNKLFVRSLTSDSSSVYTQNNEFVSDPSASNY